MALCKRAAMLARSTVVSCSSSSSRRRRPSAVKYTASPCCLLVMLSIILASVGDPCPGRPPGPHTGTRKIARGPRRDPLIVHTMIPHRGRKWHAEGGRLGGQPRPVDIAVQVGRGDQPAHVIPPPVSPGRACAPPAGRAGAGAP